MTGYVYFLKCHAPRDPRPKIYVGATNRPLDVRVNEHLRGTTESLKHFTSAELYSALTVEAGNVFRVERYLKNNPRVVLPLLSGLKCKYVDDFLIWAETENIKVKLEGKL